MIATVVVVVLSCLCAHFPCALEPAVVGGCSLTIFPGFSRKLSGMFRRSASLAIAHLKSFAAILSVSLVQLGHTNRSVFLVTRIAV